MLNVAKVALHRDDAEFIQPLHVKLEWEEFSDTRD